MTGLFHTLGTDGIALVVAWIILVYVLYGRGLR